MELWMKAALKLVVALAVLGAGTSSSQAQTQTAAAPVTVLTNATLIDATGSPPMPNMTMIIEGDRITEIREGRYEAPAVDTVRVFDLGGGFVLPGLWNNHSHLSDLLPDPMTIMAYEPLLPAAIRAGCNAMDALRRGFTSLRMTGERDFIDVAWRDAFDAGVFVGPRIIASGNPIASTGGHGWRVERPLSKEIDGPYEMP